MIEASTQFMVGRLSTKSGKCNSFNLDGIFGNDSQQSMAEPREQHVARAAGSSVDW